MPKYQIILQSNEILSDDEFQNLIQRWFDLNSWNATDEQLMHKNFKLLYAQNLEGIRKSLYDTKEDLKVDISDINSKEENNTLIEESFEEVSKLFNLDEL